MDGAIWGGYETAFRDLQMLQGVQKLSEKSNLLIFMIQSWCFYDSLGSSWPQEMYNLCTGCTNWMRRLIPS